MQSNGFVKLYRKILDNPIICKDADYFTVWIYLLLSATHTEYDGVFKNERITLKPGQLITGRKIIADKFKIDENKVQRILKNLEKQHQLEQQTSSQNRLVTIINWNEYQLRQQDEQPVNNERTTSEQPVNTNKNVKNVKNIYKEYGEYKNVFFTNEQYTKLLKEFPNDYLARIQKLDDYIQSTGKKYKDCLATIRNWAKKDGYKKPSEREEYIECILTEEEYFKKLRGK